MAPEVTTSNLDVSSLIRDLVLLALIQGLANLVLLVTLLSNRKTRNELLTHVGELVKTVTVGRLATNRGPAETVTAIRTLATKTPPSPPDAPDHPGEPEEPPVGMILRGRL